MNGDGQTGLPTLQPQVTRGGEVSPQSSGFISQFSNNAQPSFELRIEELVLHGFAPDERYAIGATVERELKRLFAARGIPASLAQAHESAHMDAGTIEVQAGADVELTGALLAQAIYAGFGR